MISFRKNYTDHDGYLSSAQGRHDRKVSNQYKRDAYTYMLQNPYNYRALRSVYMGLSIEL